MLPINIINNYKTIVQKQCIPEIKLGQQRQFVFGVNSLSAQRFVSLNSNARTTGLSRSAAESKMFRMLNNSCLRQQICKLTLKLSSVNRKSIVNVDHSEFNGLSVLMFAMQTYNGRAKPVYLETMPSLVQGHQKSSPKYAQAKARYIEWREKTGADQFGYTIICIKRLKDNLGYLPKLVFDRGFCNKRIFKALKSLNAIFYIRVNGWLKVKDSTGMLRPIEQFTPGSYQISFGCKLRLVVGSKTRRHPEPIYIITNDLTLTEKDVLRLYYHRFEIEEFFRDIKSILGTRLSRIKKHTHLATLLWFVSLGVLLLYTIMAKNKPMKIAATINPKKKLSIYRILFEELNAALRTQINIGLLSP
jgi:Transposase DDE domain